MYDTVDFWLSMVEAGQNVVNPLFNLANVKETTNRETGEVWTSGNLDNLKVTSSGAGISVKGSLAKFYFPDNTYTLTRQYAKEAIEKLSDILHLNFNNANITRLDVSANFIMQKKATRYFDVLGLCSHFNRVQATINTLYYQNSGKQAKRVLAFYNKAREVENRSGIMPDIYNGTNLLRYESRWRTRLSSQLKEEAVTGAILTDRRFYGKVINLWADNYFKIDKKRNVNMEAIEKIKTVGDAVDYVFAIALQKLQADEVQQLLKEMKERKVFDDPKYYTRLKQKLKNTASKTSITEVNDLVKELDGEIKQVLAFKR